MRKQFSEHERDNIVKGVASILQLVKPIESAVLSERAISNSVLATYLAIWKSALRPDVHWNAQTGRDNVARHVGFGFVKILLRHCETVEKREAEDLLGIVGANRFSLSEKLSVFALIARRANLSEVAGAFASSLSSDIVKDDYIEQRGESYRQLAGSLVPMSIAEAQEYYSQGLAQLDQMGGDDFDLIYSVLHYAAEQPGDTIKAGALAPSYESLPDDLPTRTVKVWMDLVRTRCLFLHRLSGNVQADTLVRSGRR